MLTCAPYFQQKTPPTATASESVAGSSSLSPGFLSSSLSPSVSVSSSRSASTSSSLFFSAFHCCCDVRILLGFCDYSVSIITQLWDLSLTISCVPLLLQMMDWEKVKQCSKPACIHGRLYKPHNACTHTCMHARIYARPQVCIPAHTNNQMATCMQKGSNSSKRSYSVPNGPKRSQMFSNSTKWSSCIMYE